MKRSFVLALSLLFTPALVSAQVEIGLDAGFSLESIDDVDDNVTSFGLPTSYARVGFPAGEMIVVETVLGFDWASVGDQSASELALVPGVNVLLGEQFYVRGEAGLMRSSFDPGTGSESTTQYLFGGGAGVRIPLGDAALFRAEAAVDRWLENSDDFIPASTQFRIGVGVSAIVG
jgi:hypothetical protein